MALEQVSPLNIPKAKVKPEDAKQAVTATVLLVLSDQLVLKQQTLQPFTSCCHIIPLGPLSTEGSPRAIYQFGSYLGVLGANIKKLLQFLKQLG